jgi:hypothetical protein
MTSESNNFNTVMKDDDKFTGDLHQWFPIDRRFLQRARSIAGDFGEELWMERLEPIAAGNKTAIHELIMKSILSAQGAKTYTFYQELDRFNTIPKLNAFREDILTKIKSYVETQSAGNALKYLTQFKKEDYANVRSKLIAKFVTADPSEIRSLEIFFDNATQEDSIQTKGLPENTNIVELFDKMEKVQATLTTICPENRAEAYEAILRAFRRDCVSDIVVTTI